MTIQNAISEFINYCKYEKNLCEKTRRAYSTDLNQFVILLMEKKYPLMLNEINKTHIRAFLQSISSLKPKSVKRKIAAMKAMFNYFEFEDNIQVNPFRKMRISIKEPKQLPRALAINDVKQIFESAYNKHTSALSTNYARFEALRNIVVVELLFATGARVSEISNLRKESIDIKSGSLTIKGKGSRERAIQICQTETLNILSRYYNHYVHKINLSGGYFLINRFGRKLSDQSIRTIVKHLTDKSKIKLHVTPHVFRHSFATLLLENDVDIKYIQSLLGHSSIITTQIYTHVNREKQRQILKLKHPRKTFSFKKF